MQPSTHLAIDARLCGAPISLAEGSASVQLTTTAEMAADERGLVHGGFVFGLADYAAMLAINHPNVVLGSAEVRLSAPVTVGESLRADATRVRTEGKKLVVEVAVYSLGPAEESVGAAPVFTGSFVCFVPSTHVLDRKATP